MELLKSVVVGAKITTQTRLEPSFDIFRRFRRFRTLRQICGKLDGLPGPKRRENRNTLSGRKSGNSSQTSTFAYFDGSIAANGVSSFFSMLFSKLELVISAKEFVLGDISPESFFIPSDFDCS